MLAHLVSNHAEKMERIGMIRLDRENLPVDLLGSLEPAGLMVLDRNRQFFGNRCHSLEGGKDHDKSALYQLFHVIGQCPSLEGISLRFTSERTAVRIGRETTWPS